MKFNDKLLSRFRWIFTYSARKKEFNFPGKSWVKFVKTLTHTEKNSSVPHSLKKFLWHLQDLQIKQSLALDQQRKFFTKNKHINPLKGISIKLCVEIILIKKHIAKLFHKLVKLMTFNVGAEKWQQRTLLNVNYH